MTESDCSPDGAPQRLTMLARGVAERRGLLVSKLASELLARVTPHLDALGLDGRDYALLAVLSTDTTGSQAELAGLCSLMPGQVIPILDALEADGLVERHRDERDRRRMLVRITAAGRTTLAAADAAAREIEDELLGPLDDEVFARLSDALRAALPAAPATTTAATAATAAR